MGALGGLAVAVLGTVLEWASVGAFGISGWNGDARFRLADWLDVTAPVDAVAVVALAAVGGYLLLAPLLGRVLPHIPYAAGAVGAAIGVLGILEYLYVQDLGSGVGVSTGVGVFALIVGGGAAAVLGFLGEAGQARPA